jgi:hypothetical protein
VVTSTLAFSFGCYTRYTSAVLSSQADREKEMFQAEIERLKLEIEKAPRGGPFFLGEEHQYHQFRLKINDGQKMSKMMLYVEASKNIQYILVMYVLVHCCEHVLI